MSNLSDNENIENKIILTQQNLDTAVANKDFLLASNLQDTLNNLKVELKNEQNKEAKKLLFKDSSFPLANEIYKTSYDIYSNYIEELENDDDIKVTMSFIGLILTEAAVEGHSLVSFSVGPKGTRIAFENGYTINLDSEWTKNALAQIEISQKFVEQNPHLASNFEEWKVYIEHKVSFIRSLPLDESIIQSVKTVFDNNWRLRRMLKYKLMKMKYLIGESTLKIGVNQFVWLNISLWPTRIVECKNTYMKRSYNDTSTFLYQDDSLWTDRFTQNSNFTFQTTAHDIHPIKWMHNPWLNEPDSVDTNGGLADNNKKRLKPDTT